MARTLAAVAGVVDGELIGPDARFEDVSSDTRTMSPGALFVALRGPHFDGNDYLAQAASAGAVGALVSRPARVEVSQITVADTRGALGRMARAWRENFDIPICAITGSSGKTTVKALLASILSQGGCRPCVTAGNLNNEIGVPLTLMRLSAEHGAAVVELGANHAGEIDYLASLVKPTVGLITNAGPAHLEGFGSVEGVARTKGELLTHLPPTGAAILNADDAFVAEWRARTSADSIVTFGLMAPADCSLIGEAEFHDDGARFSMRLPDGQSIDVALPLLGEHNVANALAAAAAAHAMGASAADIASGLGAVEPVSGRLQRVVGRRGARIIDDSYNANPASVRAAFDLIGALSGRRIVVFGDMGELGADSRAFHSEIGRYARDKCDALICVGPLAAAAAEAFGPGAVVVDDVAEAVAAVEPLIAEKTTVLVKASRMMRLERLVERLVESARDDRSGDAAC
jgi:UDP-N-acetylmuramoyl-tripeptide--D-alanyl-D-alanine ligase